MFRCPYCYLWKEVQMISPQNPRKKTKWGHSPSSCLLWVSQTKIIRSSAWPYFSSVAGRLLEAMGRCTPQGDGFRLWFIRPLLLQYKFVFWHLPALGILVPWAVVEKASILPIKYELVPEIHATVNRIFFSLTFIELNFNPFLPSEAHGSI